MEETPLSPTRPYLLRALYEWCADNNLTPYVAAYVDEHVKVPLEFVQNNEIVLNISMDATSHLQIDNDFLQFKARFGGIAREIVVPISHVIAIYARENGQGMAFPSPVQAMPPVGDVSTLKSPAIRPSMRSVSKAKVSDNVVSLGEPRDAGAEQASRPKLRSTPTGKPSLVLASKPEADEPDPMPPTKPGGSSTKRPSLTRIK